MLALTAITLLAQVQVTIPAQSVRCPKCADLGPVFHAVVSAPYSACVASGLPSRPVAVALDAARDGKITKVKIVDRGGLSAEPSQCVAKQLRAVQLPGSDAGVHLELALQFDPAPVPAEPDHTLGPPNQRCPAPGYWNAALQRCDIAPCAGIPGGCRREGLDPAATPPPEKGK